MKTNKKSIFPYNPVKTNNQHQKLPTPNLKSTRKYKTLPSLTAFLIEI